MGEAEFEQKTLVKAVDGALVELAEQATAMSVATPGGRFQVRWDEGGSATALGQLPFFAEFLEVYGGPLSQDNNAVGLSFALDFTRSGSALPRFCL